MNKMILFKTRIGESPIAQKGLFAAEAIPRKSVVFVFPALKNVHFISETEFNKAWTNPNPAKRDVLIQKSGVRYIGKTFLYCSAGEKETLFFNHSDNPNILYHCGIGFAKKNIKNGEELTIDYRYFDTEKSDNFVNVETGKMLRKYTAEEALRKSAKELSELLN